MNRFKACAEPERFRDAHENPGHQRSQIAPMVPPQFEVIKMVAYQS